MKTATSDSLKAKKVILKAKSCGYLPEGRSNRLLQGNCEGDALEVVDEERLKNSKRWSLAVSLGLMSGKWALI